MRFPYREYISRFPGSPDFRLILRPVVTVRIAGQNADAQWDALVDTGADESLLPMSLAELLGVELDPVVIGAAAGITGGRLTIRYGDVQMQIAGDHESVSWTATVGFVEFESAADEMVVLGHSGCLDYFTALFDGEQAALELTPNELLPRS